MKPIDKSIIREFNLQDRSVDDLICDPHYALNFCEGLGEPKIILKRLLAIRKQGSKKTGLCTKKSKNSD